MSDSTNLNLNECDHLDSKQQQDIVNNNHITSLEVKTKLLSIQNDTYDAKNPSLFDASVFERVKPNEFLNKYDKFELVHNEKTNEYYFDIGDGFRVRGLKRDDYDRNYLGLLAQLTVVGDVSREQFEKRYDTMRSCFNTYYVLVVEDLNKNRIAASLTHVYEQKFFRNTSARGRIEDVVVDSDYRGKGLSKILLDLATQLSKLLGCYKISLECKDQIKGLYQQFGFDLEPNQNYLCRRY